VRLLAIREDEIEIMEDWDEELEVVEAQIPNEPTSIGRLAALKRLKEVMENDSSATLSTMPSKYPDLHREGLRYFGKFWEQLVKDAHNEMRYVYDRGTELALAFQAGNRNGVFEELISQYINLTYRVLKKHTPRGSVTEEDCLQEAVIGIHTAASKYGIEKRTMLSTYAYCWIRTMITRSLDNEARMIRIPVYKELMIVGFKQARDRLQMSSKGVDPPLEAIAMEMGLELEQARELQILIINRTKTTSIHSRVHDRSGTIGATELLDLIADVSTLPVLATVGTPDLYAALADCISQLGERDQKIIKMRYGLDGDNAHTLEAIGQIIGVTRERIRQIEAEILKSLREMLEIMGYNQNNVWEVI